MKVSIITAVLNEAPYIEDCLKSILAQTYENIEHIIIDGGSTDGTLKILERYQDRVTRVICEPDTGIYDALNKGVKLVSGDIVGFLHADDFYANSNVVKTVVTNMEKYNVPGCYGDLIYVRRNNTEKVVRYWESSPYLDGLFQRGWMPPHPTFYVKKEVYDELGGFDTNFKIAADYELMLRFMERNKIPTLYIPEIFVKMRMGGTSNRSLKNIMLKTYEDIKAWKVNSLDGGLYSIFLKNAFKIPQYFRR